MLARSTFRRLATLTALLAWGTNVSAAPLPAAQATKAAAAQKAWDGLVRLTATQAASFPVALAAMAQQASVAIIAEGSPYKPTLAPDAAPDLSGGVTVGPAIAAIAAAYDYDVQKQGGVYVLTKRYTDPHDLPCLTLAECVQASKNVLQVLDTFSPHYPSSVRRDDYLDQIMAFVHTLSPEQEQAMEAKKLRYGDLAPDQQGLIRTMILYQYVQMPAVSISASLANLTYAPKSVLTDSDGKGHGGVFITLPNPLGSASADYEWPLTHELTSVITLPSVSTIRAQAASANARTLAQVVADLKPIDGVPSAVDSSLQGKLVTAAGLNSAAPMEVLQALKVIYGLHIGVSAKGGNELEPLPASIPLRLSEIGPDAWAAMPLPLVRALHLDDAVETVPPAGSAPAVFLKGFMEQSDRQMLPERVRDAAASQVLAAILPRLKQEGQGAKIPVASLGPAAQDALAVALVSDLFGTLYTQYRPEVDSQINDSLDNMDQTIIYGRPETNPNTHAEVHSLFMAGVDPSTGQNVSMGGAGWNSY